MKLIFHFPKVSFFIKMFFQRGRKPVLFRCYDADSPGRKSSSIRLIFKKFYFKQEGNLSSLSAMIQAPRKENAVGKI